MKRAITVLVAGLLLLAVAFVIAADRYLWLAWVATPDGLYAIGWIAAALAVTAACAIAMRVVANQRDRRYYEDLQAGLAWEQEIPVSAPVRGHRPPVRRITPAEMDRESDRIEAELRTEALPQVVIAAVVVAPPPPQLPAVRQQVHPARMFTLDGYNQYAAQAMIALREGWALADETIHARDVHAGLRRQPDPNVIDAAPVSPASSYLPRHDADHPRPLAHVIGYDRVAARVLNEATGAFPVVVVRELEGAST